MYEVTTITAFECACEKCGHCWTSTKPTLPTHCPNKKCTNPTKWNAGTEKSEVLAIESSVLPITPPITAPTRREPIIISEPADDPNWRFTSDKPQFDDSGKVYRKQILAPHFKQSRTVEVDADNHGEILRIA